MEKASLTIFREDGTRLAMLTVWSTGEAELEMADTREAATRQQYHFDDILAVLTDVADQERESKEQVTG